MTIDECRQQNEALQAELDSAREKAGRGGRRRVPKGMAALPPDERSARAKEMAAKRWAGPTLISRALALINRQRREISAKEIIARIDAPEMSIRQALYRLVKEGRIESPDRGRYRRKS